MRYGEMMDLITCDSIHSGAQEPKKRKRKISFDEAMKLR